MNKMNATQAIEKIVNLLGLKFQKENFYKTQLVDGETEVTNNYDGEFQVGQSLYVVKESTLVPAPEGSHETREGLVLTVDAESTIVKIESKIDEAVEEVVEDQEELENSKEEVKMVEAKDAQGNLLESNTFDVGEDVSVIGEDGSKTPAPDGEHQVVLKDSEGNEVKIRIQTKDGKIVQRENVEEMSSEEPVSKQTETEFSQQLFSIKEGIETLLDVVNSMNGKFKTEISSLREDMDNFKKQPERKAVEQKKFFKESFEDYRISLLKELKNKN